MMDKWSLKLAAWTHDPVEKAFVLFRDPAGHEGGTCKTLQNELFGGSIDAPSHEIVRMADRWAAAADRPQFPLEETPTRLGRATRVDFVKDPVLIHPLSQEEYRLTQRLEDCDFNAVKAVSLDHFRDLVVRTTDGAVDPWLTFLSFWRYGPESPAPDLGALWSHLPADTRVPDHSIWEHLRLASAFASSLAAGTPSLLEVSLGPVQGFIAQARTTSDLWAGSHLLSSLTWEALRVVCEEWGPDAILFPDLQGVPVVDLWLRGLGVNPPPGRAAHELDRMSDANPLYTAALPNRFVALVPDGAVEGLTARIQAEVRRKAAAWATEAWERVVEAALGADASAAGGATEQIVRQMAGFPEVTWASVPWSLVEAGEGSLDVSALSDRLSLFGGRGFLDSDGWKLLARELKVDGVGFFKPNPGVAYPGLFELLGHVTDSVKRVRKFEATLEEGYRCSLCGEREWLTTEEDRATGAHGKHRGGSKGGQAWSALPGRRPSWGRKGEHLCAVCTLKRVWPDIFGRQIGESLGSEAPRRFVVSTHTMAFSSTLESILENEKGRSKLIAVVEAADPTIHGATVALPRSLARKVDACGDERLRRAVRRLPALYDDLADEADGDLLRRLDGALADVEAPRERYYGLILLDGDKMGAWIGGEAAERTHDRSWHPKVRAAMARDFGDEPTIAEYRRSQRSPSPSYHAALSRALNGFAIHAVGQVVEELCLGKVLYAGGDDVLAMVSPRDVVRAMVLLRAAYSGTVPKQTDLGEGEILRRAEEEGLTVGGGYLRRRGGANRLIRTLGGKATASMGCVVAHCSAPLGAVLRELRNAERLAKHEGGRDAWTITLMRRAGGLSTLTCPWWWVERDDAASPAGVLGRLRELLSRGYLGRRAAYESVRWLEGVPSPDAGSLDSVVAMTRALVAQQFRRHGGRNASGAPTAGGLALDVVARDLAAVAGRLVRAEKCTSIAATVGNLLGTAEFLARAERAE